VLVVNASMINRTIQREDIRAVMIPGNEIAEGLGDRRMTNMVLLGGLLANLPVLPLESIERSLEAHLPVRHHRLLPLNIQALHRGAEYAAQGTEPAKRVEEV
jgi:2-oxoglutarate ferredoxin oxidoreductase subunit gamma